MWTRFPRLNRRFDAALRFNVGRRCATRAEFMASDDSNSKAGMLFDGAGNER
jgi:hypothetical protein